MTEYRPVHHATALMRVGWALAGCLALAMYFLPHHGSVNMGNQDTYLTQLLSGDPHKVEALSWLERNDGKERTVGESSEDMDGAESLGFVRDLYARGVVKVTAIDLEIDTHMETTSTLIIQLPADASARKNIFDVEARIAHKGGFDPEEDHGQHFLMLRW